MTRQPRVFISRTTTGLAALAEQVAEVLRQRGIEPIIQTGFYPSTHDIKGMLAEHLQQCDAVICLIGTAYGSGPHDPITKAEQPVHGLKDPRTKDRLFSYTQLELLIARDLGRPIYTFFIQGDELPTAFAPEPPELALRQQTFITEFARDGRNTYGTFSLWDQPADPARGLKQAIEAIKFEITVLAGKPTNLPYTSLGTLFKGRDEFLAELRQHLTAEGPVVIKGKRTIHGMGGVGKTRAAIEYAWKHADDYRALLFISADTPEALHRSLAALCGPLVLNLPEQNEKKQALQVEAALRWLKLHPGWFLIIDNVDNDEAAEETKALLAKLTTGHVLITSRISDWKEEVKALDLDVLSEGAAIAFLDERTKNRRPEKEDDHEKVAALVQLLDCLALALEQAGAHISTSAISYADYIALWESHRPDALSWHDEEEMKYPKSLAITYETSVAQLSDGAKNLFRIFSWFAPDPIPRNLLDSLSNASDEKRHLIEIERLHLARFLVRVGEGQNFAIHRLNQEITKQQQEKIGEVRALKIALDWLDAIYRCDSTDVRTWTVLRPINPHAIAAATAADDRKIPDPAGRLLNECGLLLKTQGDYTCAEPLYRKSVALGELTFGTNHTEFASRLNNLAQLLHDTNRLAEAESLMRRALAIDESINPINHSKIAIRRANLAALLLDTNHLAEAELLMRKSIRVEHEKLATCLSNLGQLLKSTNRLAEAEPLMRRALAIDETAFGRDHPDVAVRLNNLGMLLHATGSQTQAEELLRRALQIDETAFGIDHPKIAIRLTNLALVVEELGQLEEAEALTRRALQIAENAFGLDHPSVAIVLNNLALLLLKTNREDEVQSLLGRVIAINEASFGKGHPKVTIPTLNLASLFYSEGKLSEAEVLTRRGLETLVAASVTSGHPHPDFATVVTNYHEILTNMGYPHEQVRAKINSVISPVAEI